MRSLTVLAFLSILLSCSPPSEDTLRDMVLIPAGSFTMGSPETEEYREQNEIQHRVSISSFYMSKYEVSQEQWKAKFGTNPSRHRTEGAPVDWVNWNMAIVYCNSKSIELGLDPVYELEGLGRDPKKWNLVAFTSPGITEQIITHFEASGFRLPTEAEWEHAARAGHQQAYIAGDDITVDDANWKIKPNYSASLKVGLYPPNAFGLYDMSGNVMEWTNDWYADYDTTATQDPRGPSTGTFKTMKGASWGSLKKDLRLAYRNYYPPHKTSSNVGLRLVKNLKL